MPHYLLFKPFGYLSQFKRGPQKRRKKLLGELFDFAEGTMAIGRLDEASEGLLLLSTDGMESERIRQGGYPKQYWVQVDGDIQTAAIEKLRNGIEINIHGQYYTTQKCKVEKLDTPPTLPPRSKPVRSDRHGPSSWINITLTEGKFRQIRKMTAAVGHPTLRLVRHSIGKLNLRDMQPGQVIEVPKLLP
jgi:23S rRNA pseudouridine2457 synthase